MTEFLEFNLGEATMMNNTVPLSFGRHKACWCSLGKRYVVHNISDLSAVLSDPLADNSNTAKFFADPSSCKWNALIRVNSPHLPARVNTTSYALEACMLL